eukprot:g52745.t1
MGSSEYTWLPGNEEPVKSSRSLKTGLLLASGLVGVAGGLSALSSLFSNQHQAGHSFVPKVGVDRVLIKPALPDAIAFPNPLSLNGPNAIFLYAEQAAHDTTLTAGRECDVEDGVVYGAQVYGAERARDGRAQSLLATPTGNAADTIRGRLLTCARGDVSLVLQKADDLADQAAARSGRETSRGTVRVVTKDGSYHSAFWYYLPLGAGVNKTEVALGAKRTGAEVVDALPANALHGKTIFITGSYVGLGEETARQLLRAGAHIVAANRDPVKQAAWLEKMRREAGLSDGLPALLNELL